MKKNTVIILAITMMISLLSACQKENSNENETGGSNTITEVPTSNNEATQTEDTEQIENNITDSPEDTASTDGNQQTEDAENNEANQKEEDTFTEGKDTDKQEDKTTTGGKETNKQEDKASTGSKDTDKQKDKTSTGGKETDKQKDKNSTGGKETDKQKDKNSTGDKETSKQDDKKPTGDKDKNNQNESSKEDEAKDSFEDELSSIVDSIYGIKDPGLRLANSALDLNNKDMVKYNTGLEDTSKVKEVIVSEAMIISQAYSLVLVRVNDVADAKSVAEDMLEGINPAKWICVRADDLKVVAYKDVVLLIMMGSQFSETVTSDQIVDAFEEICGGKLDLELEQ